MNSKWLYKKILVLSSILIMLAVSLIACDFRNEKLIADVDDYSVQDVEFNYFSSNRNDLVYSAVNYDGIHYLNKADFISLCNSINKKQRLIEDVSKLSFSSDNMILSIDYRTDTNFAEDYLASIIFSTSFISEKVSDPSEVKQVQYNFKDLLLSPILVDDEVYFPLDIIRYNIFNGESCFIRTVDNKYEILGKESAVIASNGGAYFLRERNDYSHKISYQLSYDILSRLIDPGNGGKSKNKNIIDYPELYMESVKLLDALEDYHVSVLALQQEISQERLEQLDFNIFIEESFFKKYYDKLPTQEDDTHFIDSEQLSDEAYLITLNSFAVEESEFVSEINKILDEISNKAEVEELIIDLRNNPGGSTANAGYCLEKFINNQFTVRVAPFIDGKRIKDHMYSFEKLNPIKKKYSFTIIVNEHSASNTIVFANIMKENMESKIIGREPLYKQTSHKSLLQTLDGTIFTKSFSSFAFVTEDGELLNVADIVDEVMSDDEINDYIGDY